MMCDDLVSAESLKLLSSSLTSKSFPLLDDKKIYLPLFDSTSRSLTELFRDNSHLIKQSNQLTQEKCINENSIPDLNEVASLFLSTLKQLIVNLNERKIIENLRGISKDETNWSVENTRAIGQAYREFVASTGALVIINGFGGQVKWRTFKDGRKYNIIDLLNEKYSDLLQFQEEEEEYLKGMQFLDFASLEFTGQEKELLEKFGWSQPEKVKLEEGWDLDGWLPNDSFEVMDLISNIGYLGSYYFFKTSSHFQKDNETHAKNFAQEFDITENLDIKTMRNVVFSIASEQQKRKISFNESWDLLIYPLLRAIDDEVHFYMKRAEIIMDYNWTPNIFDQENSSRKRSKGNQNSKVRKNTESEELKSNTNSKENAEEEYLMQLQRDLKEKCIEIGNMARKNCNPIIGGYKVSLKTCSKWLKKRSFPVPSTMATAWLFFIHQDYINENWQKFYKDASEIENEKHVNFLSDIVDALLYPAFHFEGGSKARIQRSSDVREKLRTLAKEKEVLVDKCNKLRGGNFLGAKKCKKIEIDQDKLEKEREKWKSYLPRIYKILSEGPQIEDYIFFRKYL